MGYESKIYVVEKTSIIDNEKRYAQEIATFKLGKIYFLSDVLRNNPITDCFVYADDGNTQVIEDRYGDALTESTIEEVISILEKAVSNGEDYRRIFPLLSTLNTIKERREQWGNIAVLHFGY